MQFHRKFRILNLIFVVKICTIKLEKVGSLLKKNNSGDLALINC